MSDELVTDNPAPEPTAVENSGQEPVEHDAPQEDTANTAAETEQETGSDDELVALLDEETPEADVEVEYEGKTYKVKPELKDALLRQSDYTRKTQEAAEIRKKAEEHLRIANTYGEEFGKVKSIEAEFNSKFANMDRQAWLDLQANDPVEFQRKRFEHDSLIQDYRTAQAGLQQAQQEATQRQREALAKAQTEAAAKLKELIPGWSDSKVREVSEAAAKEYQQYGLDPSRLSNVSTAAEWVILNDALAYRKLRAKASKAKPSPKAEPVPTVNTRQGGGARDPSKMSTSEIAKHLGLPS